MNKTIYVELGIAELLTIIFAILKLMGIISWEWLWVFAPLWISIIAIIAIIYVVPFVTIVIFKKRDYF